LKSALLGTAAIATARAMQSETALAAASVMPLDALSDELDHQFFGGDGLARPIPTEPTVSGLAKGLDRTLALGGGGEYYVAWYCGFFHGLYDHGLDMAALPEMVVGTSAGSYMGSSLTSGHFLRLSSQFEFFGHFPQIFARLAPLSSPNASQQRALKLSAAAKDGEIATLRTIGHAALAADNHVNGEAVSRLAAPLPRDRRTGPPGPEGGAGA